jgi:hypothetical protein
MVMGARANRLTMSTNVLQRSGQAAEAGRLGSVLLGMPGTNLAETAVPVLIIVEPEPVTGWHGKGFRLFWTWK